MEFRNSTLFCLLTLFMYIHAPLAVSDTSISTIRDTMSIHSTQDTIPSTYKDTSIRLWYQPFTYWNCGWEIGGYELFDMWVKQLPIKKIDTLIIKGKIISIPIPLAIKEQPSPYNVSFPFTYGFSFSEATDHFFDVSLCCAWMGKRFKAAIENDSKKYYYLEKYLSIISSCVSVSYAHIIKEQYFSITGFESTYLAMGCGILPLVALIDMSVQKPQTKSYTQNNYGTGFNWKCGMTSFHKLSQKSALINSFMYTGSWYGIIYSTKGKTTISSFLKDSKMTNQPLHFVTHRFLITLGICSIRKQNNHE